MLCQNVVDLARKNRMRIGYIEFNTGAEKFVDGATRTFFTRNYDGLHRRMGEVACEGLTNYEQPLAVVLDEFAQPSGIASASGGR